MRGKFPAGLIASAVLAGAGAASASILSTSGAMTTIAPPADVRLDVFESDTEIRIFTEQTGLILQSNLNVDHAGPGAFSTQSIGSLSPSSIASGAAVNVYFMHFDKLGDSEELVGLSGSVTFSEQILGVLVLGKRAPGDPDTLLDDTDATLGHAGTIYPTGLNLRGTLDTDIVIDGTHFIDTFEISPDGRTLSYDGAVSTRPDQIRIITAVPAPGSAVVLLIAGGCVRQRRR